MGLDKSKNVASKQREMTWVLPIVLLAASLVILLGAESAREGLRYDRLALEQGQLWRLFSGHLSHLGWSHFALNGAGLGLVWMLVGGCYSSRAWWLITVATLLTIDLGFWVLHPELSWYVGLSGLLHGFLAAGLVARIGAQDAETLVLAVLLAAKLAWEQFGGALPGSAAISGGPVVVVAHLYGTVGGLLGALLVRIRVRPKGSI